MSDTSVTEAPPAPDARTQSLPRSVLDNLLEGCQVISPDYRYLYVNDAILRQGNATREALLGRTMMECYPGIEHTEMFSLLRACMEQRSAATMENEFTFSDGSKRWFELRFEAVPDGVAILSVDVTDRKRAEIALRRTLRALTTLSRCNQTLVRAIDEQRFVQDVCDLVVESGGYRAARIALRPAGNGSKGEAVERASAGAYDAFGEALSFEIRSGEEGIGILTICAEEPEAFDSDERALLEEIALDLGYGIQTLRAQIAHARTEEQLIAAQRLEAVGRLAGGVAHDFNNLLSVILTYAGFAAEQFHESDPIREDLEQVREAGERAAALTRQLLAFSRKQVMEPQVTNVNKVIEGIESMLQRLLGADVDMRVHAASDLGNVLADPGQLEQVIMNLAVNARDAMPQGGKLTIETDNVELDESYAEEHLSLEPGRYVRVSVSDTGTGMSAETQSRIFEPFFTTKGKGTGTGLGLSMVYGIVKQSGGTLWVYSEQDEGTTFKIYLPRVDAPAVHRKRVPSIAPPTGDGTILLVEDEPSVRKAAERILRSAGYRILSAANGGEALLQCERFEGRIDLLLTDVVMPEMSGRTLAARLKQRNPDLKVLFASGYTDAAIVHHGVLDGGRAFISKPFSAAELARKVRDVLDDEG
jgi:PAS domain S-box-containing protein